MQSRYRLRRISCLGALVCVFLAFALFVDHVTDRYLMEQSSAGGRPQQGPTAGPNGENPDNNGNVDFGPRPDGTLLITELMASNKVGLQDEDGDRSDWLEITNFGTESVDLKGYYLSESKSNKRQWAFPSVVLEPGEVLVVFASDKDRRESGKELHTNFKLNMVEQSVFLYDSYGTIWDQVVYKDLDSDYALARTGSAQADGFEVRSWATPGFVNSEASLELYFAQLDGGSVGGDGSVSDGRGSGLVINEVMSANFSYLKQGSEYYDWIELKNCSDQSISLKDYYLSDKAGEPTMWQLPNKTLAPGACFVIMASGDPQLGSSSRPHTNFEINGMGDQVFLFTEGEVVDCLFASGLTYGGSYGRMSGQVGFFYFAQPTPGEENRDGKRFVADRPTATASGAYDTARMELSLSGEGTFYYTLDGSAPTRESARYTGPITIEKTTVLRAIAVVEGKVDSWITTGSYFLQEGHSLPIVNISLAPDDLWSDETGIYATGPNASDTEPYYGANFHQDWEKRANMTFIDGGKEEFNLDCGLKIFGGWGRAERKKSFQVKFRSRYGTSSLEYALFESQPEITEYTSLVVRSGSQDSAVAMMRDELLTGLAADGTSLLVQAQRHCVLYLNGEFWGVYVLRERINADFIVAHEQVSKESVTLLELTGLAEYGSNKEFMALRSYIFNHDMQEEEHYEYVKARLDFDSTIDWFIMEAYSGNRDLSNVRYYKTTEGDGKYRWIFFDLDMAMLSHTDPIGYMMRTSGTDSNITTMTRRLLKNDEFRDLFFQRLAKYCQTILSTNYVMARIDSLYELMLPEMERDQKKWGRKLSYWQTRVQWLRDYVSEDGEDRVDILWESAVRYFDLTEAEAERYWTEAAPV